MSPEEAKQCRHEADKYRRLADAYAHKAMMALMPNMREFYQEREAEYLAVANDWDALADQREDA